MADDSGANPQLPSLAKPDAPATEGAVTAPPPPAPAETTAAKSVAGPTSAAVEPPAEAKGDNGGEPPRTSHDRPC